MWETRLKHQINDLPGFDLYVRELTGLIKGLYKKSFED